MLHPDSDVFDGERNIHFFDNNSKYVRDLPKVWEEVMVLNVEPIKH